jgi:hypothetical protein
MTDITPAQAVENIVRALQDLKEKDPAQYLDLLKKIEAEVDEMKNILA